MISQTDGLGQAQTAVSGALGQAPQTTRRRYSNLSVTPVAIPRRDLGVGCYIKVKAIKLSNLVQALSSMLVCTAIKLKQ